jgi:sulfite reductase (ferredoxin)
MSTPETAKESKAERVERLKRALNPWEARAAIDRFARDGYESIPPEWLTTYFRWWGVYTQGDGGGAVGGKGGEGRATRFFMVRIRIPGGALQAHQARTIADLAERHARSVADITVRQNIQLHWVTLEALPLVLDALARIGLSTLGACGDVTRNVTGCPLAGLDRDELVDASPLVDAATRMLNGNPAFYNLPRKYKVSITGCRVWCTYPEINDLGLTARTHPRTGETGFGLRVGGGLSTDPHLAVPLDAFVEPCQVLPVVRAVSEVFRDSDVLRQSRDKARLKFLFLAHGWTAPRFLEAVEARLGHALERLPPAPAPEDVYRDHVGIHRQKQPGYRYVGAAVLSGRIAPAALCAVAGLAERYGSGEVRLTNMQNLVVPNAPRARAERLAAALTGAGLAVEASPFHRGTIACTGSEFCKLALTETKGFARELVRELETRLPGFDEHLKLHVTGCPNGCGQHWIADIGLEGKKVRVDGAFADAYYVCVGGALGRHQATARPIGLRLPAHEAAPAIERLLRAFLGARRGAEPFRAFCARHTDAELRALLAGAPGVEIAERDPVPGRPPHGVDG